MPAPLLDRIGRLATLHNAMATAHAEGRNGVPSLDLQSEMGCQRTTLYRLADDLRDLGAPLDYSPEDHLWSYRNGWNFPVQIIQTLQGPVGIRMALDFLLDPAMEHDLQGLLVIDPALRRASGATLPRLTGRFSASLLSPLSRALKERREVRIEYAKASEEQARWRTVQPLDLFEWDGMPYLQAHDASDPKSPFKRFALSRIHSLKLLDSTFQPPARRYIPSCLGAFCGQVFDAVIQADSIHAPYVKERKWHPRQKTRELPTGEIEFTLPFGDYAEAARWILGRGPGFRPVAPEPLVEGWAKAVSDLYSRVGTRSVS